MIAFELAMINDSEEGEVFSRSTRTPYEVIALGENKGEMRGREYVL